MQTQKAHILKIDSPTSNEYANVCARSCDKVGLKWEYFIGFQKQSGKSAFGQLGIKNLPVGPVDHINSPSQPQKASCATAGHFAIWKKIANGSEDVGIVLEHDAVMLQPMAVDVPDNAMVVLGYKLQDPSRYDHVSAGAPKELIGIIGHEGAHAYAITKATAQLLINEIESNGIRSAIDNDYFIKGQRRTKVPLMIASPTPAMGWLRESTIWNKSAARNYQFIPTFQKYYK